MRDLSFENYFKTRQYICDKIEQILVFVNAYAKKRFDNQHKSLKNIKINDQMYFQLHHEYKFLDQKSRKFLQQWIDLFRVLKMLNGGLMIKLQLFLIMNIHPYVSIMQFEFAPIGDDFYERFVAFSPPIINVFGSESEYEIDFLIKKKTVIKTDKALLEFWYLTKWKNYDFEENKWIKFSDLKNAQKLVDDLEKKLENEQKMIINTFKHLSQKFKQHGPDRFRKMI